MSIENVQLALQAISVICVPIIAYVVNSLRKINKRVDDFKDEYHKNRLEDSTKFGELSKNIAEIAVSQKHSIEIMRGLQKSFDRIQDFMTKNR